MTEQQKTPIWSIIAIIGYGILTGIMIGIALLNLSSFSDPDPGINAIYVSANLGGLLFGSTVSIMVFGDMIYKNWHSQIV
jgi:hypothetical protein